MIPIYLDISLLHPLSENSHWSWFCNSSLKAQFLYHCNSLNSGTLIQFQHQSEHCWMPQHLLRINYEVVPSLKHPWKDIALYSEMIIYIYDTATSSTKQFFSVFLDMSMLSPLVRSIFMTILFKSYNQVFGVYFSKAPCSTSASVMRPPHLHSPLYSNIDFDNRNRVISSDSSFQLLPIILPKPR